jgi:hypothetical protein
MGNSLRHWMRSKPARRALGGLLVLLALILVAGQLLGWWPAVLDSLRGTAGVEGVQPSQVTLAYFSGEAAGSQVTLQWATEIEIGNQGFNLYRSGQAGEPFIQINSDLIPSQAQGGPAGTTYQFADTPSTAGTVEYRLESVDGQGLTTYLGATTVEVSLPSSPPQAGISQRLFLPLIRR